MGADRAQHAELEIVVVDDPTLLSTLDAVESEISQAFNRENYPLSFSEEELHRRKSESWGRAFHRRG